MFNWDDMKYFLYVAQLGSYSLVAKRLGVNHSTVSRRIKAIEADMGVKLFVQTSKGYLLTEDGQEILSHAEMFEETADLISRKVFGKNQTLTGAINITMPQDIYEYFLAEPLSRISINNPKLVLNLSLTNNVQNLAVRESDIAVRLTVNPPEDLIGKEIITLNHAIYVHRDKVLLDGESVGLILLKGELSIPEWAINSFKLCHIAMRVDDLTSMYTAVKMGVGVAFMPCYLPSAINNSEVIQYKKFEPVKLNWSLWVLHHMDVRSSKKVKLLKSTIIKALTEQSAIF